MTPPCLKRGRQVGPDDTEANFYFPQGCSKLVIIQAIFTVFKNRPLNQPHQLRRASSVTGRLSLTHGTKYQENRTGVSQKSAKTGPFCSV